MSRHGFTLLEVVVALLVLAIALGALVGSVTRHTEVSAQLKERTIAHWLAMNLVAEKEALKAWPAPGSREEGRTELGGHRWRWELKTEKTPAPSVRRLIVQVRRRDDTVITRLEAWLPQP